MKYLFLLFCFFIACNSDSKLQEEKIKHIDSVAEEYSNLLRRIVTDTTYLNGDTTYTIYAYDEPNKLLYIKNKKSNLREQYISYILNDSLIKVIVLDAVKANRFAPLATYYFDNGQVIKQEEVNAKLPDINAFLTDQRMKIKYFNTSLSKRL